MGEAGEARVIADSSALITYARSGHLDVLKDLFGGLEIPAAVEDECLKRGERRPGAAASRQAVDAGWIHISPTPRATSQLTRKHPNLGLGEAAVLALARESRADVALIDDGLARQVAKIERLPVVGSLGILAVAHERGVLKTRGSVEAVLRVLLRNGLWVGADLVEDFWEALGGRP